MQTPSFTISRCSTRPVEWAMALGGVLMGRHMETEAAMAIPMSTVFTPPMELMESPIALQTTAKMGTKRAAVAVLEIKLESV